MVQLSLAVSLLLASVASAQSLLASTLPACAQQCNILLQAQASCQTNPSSAKSCFCQSALLTQVKSTPSTNQCNGVCSDSDWQSIASWYNGECANGGVNTASSTLSTITSAPASATGAGATTTSAPAVASGGPAGTSEPSATGTYASSLAAETRVTDSTSPDDPANYKNGSQWWAGHYQWVIMIIVLLVAFTVIGVVGSICFRRHKRRRGAAGMSGSARQWGPNSSAHDFNDNVDNQARRALAAGIPVTDEKAESGDQRRSKTLARKFRGR